MALEIHPHEQLSQTLEQEIHTESYGKYYYQLFECQKMLKNIMHITRRESMDTDSDTNSINEEINKGDLSEDYQTIEEQSIDL